MIPGVDTSHWEDNPATPITIDWQHMAAVHGIRFAIMKASGANSSGCYTDTVYQLHSGNAKGILMRGSFHFFSSDYDPAAQAEYYWNQIKNNAEELPPAIDVEGSPYGNLKKGAELQAQLKSILERMEKLSGRIPMIYCNQDILWNYIQIKGQPNSWLLKYPLWFSWPNTTPPPSSYYNPYPKVTVWQNSYTGNAHDLGIPEATAVDLDQFMGTEDEFKKFCASVPPLPPLLPGMRTDLLAATNAVLDKWGVA